MSNPRIRKIWRRALFVLVFLIVGISWPWVLFIGGLLAVDWGYTKYEEVDDVSFEAERWRQGSREQVRASTGESSAPRIKMYRDLVADETLIGMKREEIVAMLGQPENYPFDPPWDWNYWLGPQRGIMKLDSYWLAVRFNQRDEAVDVEVLQD